MRSGRPLFSFSQERPPGRGPTADRYLAIRACKVPIRFIGYFDREVPRDHNRPISFWYHIYIYIYIYV